MQRVNRIIGGGRWVTGWAKGWVIGLVLAPLPVLALNLNQPEVLNYRVHYGLISAGQAQFAYTPLSQTAAKSRPYKLEVALRDSIVWVELNSRYTILGQHQPRAFTSQSYHAVQRENDYRADKRVVFDTAKKQITYTNNRDANDKASPVKWDGQMKDMFSQLYALRMGGLAALKTPKRTRVMGLKEPFILVQGAAQQVAVAQGQEPLWQVPMQAEELNGKRSRDSWLITVREDADKTLTPVKIQAQTRFGNFTASLVGAALPSTPMMKDRPR